MMDLPVPIKPPEGMLTRTPLDPVHPGWGYYFFVPRLVADNEKAYELSLRHWIETAHMFAREEGVELTEQPQHIDRERCWYVEGAGENGENVWHIVGESEPRVVEFGCEGRRPDMYRVVLRWVPVVSPNSRSTRAD